MAIKNFVWWVSFIPWKDRMLQISCFQHKVSDWRSPKHINAKWKSLSLSVIRARSLDWKVSPLRMARGAPYQVYNTNITSPRYIWCLSHTLQLHLFPITLSEGSNWALLTNSRDYYKRDVNITKAIDSNENSCSCLITLNLVHTVKKWA